MRIFDGLLSFLTALVALMVCAVPIWYAHLAAMTGPAPIWAYGPIAGLFFFGMLVILAFLNKAFRGIGPLRERRR